MRHETRQYIVWGLIGSSTLLILYFLILTLANSFSHALEQFKQKWYWFIPLLIGFGIQVGLFTYIHSSFKRHNSEFTKKDLSASTGVSAFSMVACCAHHLTDILPILGISAVALFLTKYQLFFIFLGISSNILGILYMLEIIKSHFLEQESKIFNRIFNLDLKLLRNQALVGSFILLLISIFLININKDDTTKKYVKSNSIASASDSFFRESGNIALQSVINDDGGLLVEARPINVSSNQQVELEISLNTHQGDLDFDLTKKSILADDKGNRYEAKEWIGGRGGHHLSGILVFPSISTEAQNIKLTIYDVYGISQREFQWNLN